MLTVKKTECKTEYNEINNIGAGRVMKGCHCVITKGGIWFPVVLKLMYTKFGSTAD